MAGKSLELLINLLKVNNCESVVEENNKAIYLKTKDGQQINGIISAALYIGEQSSKQDFVGETLEEQAAIYQWLEYWSLNANRKENKAFLAELNSHLQDKVYFVSTRLTIADVVLFLGVHADFLAMTFQDKEVYDHLSRWFKQVQFEVKPHKDLIPVTFSKTSLYV